MASFLDFLNTPAGMGLLSGVASYAANARRGAPVNSIGRGLAGGLLGYQSAIDAQKAEQENAVARQYRQMQMDEMQRKLADQQAIREAAKEAASGAFKTDRVYTPTGNTSPVMPNMSGAPDAIGDYSMMPVDMGAPFGVQGQPNPVTFDNVAQQRKGEFDPYMYQTMLAEKLFQRGMPEEAAKYLPKRTEVGTVSPDKFTPSSIAVFTRTGNYADLVPVETVEKEPDLVKQYKFAVEQGFDGTFTDFKKIVPEAQAAIMYPWRASEAADRDRTLDIREREADYTLPPPKKSKVSQGFTVTAPDGKTYSFPNKEKADAFRRSIGGR